MADKNRNDRKGMTTEEAGRKGGEATARTHGHEFYEEIAKKGGETVARERGPEFYSEIGKKGGEASHGGGRPSAGSRSDD